MKYQIKRKLHIEMTLDSSETLMFTKGGKHQIKIEKIEKFDDEQQEDISIFNHLREDWDIIEISVQMERKEQGRFDFITGEAKKHKERIQSENQQT